MKKLFTLLLLSFITVTTFAQTAPNRVLVRDKAGNVKGYLVENIDSIYFASETRRVAADVEFKNFSKGETGDTIWLAVTRTEACQAFRIAVLPTNRMNFLTSDAAIANYMEQQEPTLYWQDFTNAEMTGFEFDFKDDTDYTIITMGYDQFGIACSSSRADFHTPRIPVVGNPTVEWTLDEVGTDYATFTFKPSADAVGYSYCLFGKGEAEEQFNSFGAMFGFANIGEMVKGWGLPHEGEYTYTYTDLNPGKEYEILVQPWDINGTNADIIVIPFTTSKLGGEGLAEVEITIGDFVNDPSSGTYQVITFTPNDQTSLHHDMIIEKSTYESEEWGEEGVLNYLKSDTNPYNPFDPYWDQFGTDESGWNADPGVTYIAFAIAKNINGEWGTLARKEFTTPAAPAGVARKQRAMPARKQVAVPAGMRRVAGMAVMKTGGVSLTQK